MGDRDQAVVDAETEGQVRKILVDDLFADESQV
jgi:hypothetical protein